MPQCYWVARSEGTAVHQRPRRRDVPLPSVAMQDEHLKAILKRDRFSSYVLTGVLHNWDCGSSFTFSSRFLTSHHFLRHKMSSGHSTPSDGERDPHSPPNVPHDVDSDEKNIPNLGGKEEAWKSANKAPDGGLTAWLVILGSWCVLFCSFGWINSMQSDKSLKKI